MTVSQIPDGVQVDWPPEQYAQGESTGMSGHHPHALPLTQVPASPPRVLGIDPGLNITGYGVLEVAAGGPLVCEAGVIRGRTKGSLTARIQEIYEGVRDVVQSLRPAAVAVEQLYSHYQRPRTAILMGHARGVILLAAAQSGVPVFHYPATQIKSMMTGHGHAGKNQMQQAVQLELRLSTLPQPPDVADALAIALCHYYRQPAWMAITRQNSAS